jgi:hypothetical protein
MYIFCGTGSCPPLWEDWHDIICIYSVALVLVYLCGKIGMILYVYILWHRFLSTSVGRLAWYYMYIFCGTGSCPPLWEDWHDIICIYSVAPVLFHLCGKIGMILYIYILWHRFFSTSMGRLAWYYMYIYSVAPFLFHLFGKIGMILYIYILWYRFLSTSVGRLAWYYMCIFCGTGSCPPLWEDWHDIICIYILWHRFLSTSVGRLAWYYMYIFCGIGSDSWITNILRI